MPNSSTKIIRIKEVMSKYDEYHECPMEGSSRQEPSMENTDILYSSDEKDDCTKGCQCPKNQQINTHLKYDDISHQN